MYGNPVAIGVVQPGMLPYNVVVVPDIPPDEALVLKYRVSAFWCMYTYIYIWQQEHDKENNEQSH